MTLEIRIASPCTEKWEEMSGDERARHCAKCKLNVFNIKEMTEPEVRALLSSKTGRVCGRVYRRADGTVLTKDCPTGLKLVRKKALMALAMTASMLVAGTAYAMGRQPAACVKPGAPQSWFDRMVTSKVIAAREELRETKTLGPVVNELWPVERFEMGDIGP
ncbi:MAG: hypothetical protein QM817_34925 [Archangium sp.]